MGFDAKTDKVHRAMLAAARDYTDKFRGNEVTNGEAALARAEAVLDSAARSWAKLSAESAPVDDLDDVAALANIADRRGPKWILESLQSRYSAEADVRDGGLWKLWAQTVANVCLRGASDMPEPPAAPGYPAGWPRCPGCGSPALDGKVTCGDAACGPSAGGGR
ncbi:MAG TPA: hypothetical protein VFL90_06285 [Methylomirabilota bacterium]|nr:hypothetical protein [Methylomirabilota bacterium]